MKEVRPVSKWSDELKIKMEVYLVKIANVLQDDQSVNIYVRMQITWKDSKLMWTPKEYNNLDSIVLPANQIWIPDIHLVNSAVDDDAISPSFAEISSDGTVRTTPVTNLNAHCDFDFKNFPFDSQKCDFVVSANWENI